MLSNTRVNMVAWNLLISLWIYINSKSDASSDVTFDEARTSCERVVIQNQPWSLSTEDNLGRQPEDDAVWVDTILYHLQDSATELIVEKMLKVKKPMQLICINLSKLEQSVVVPRTPDNLTCPEGLEQPRLNETRVMYLLQKGVIKQHQNYLVVSFIPNGNYSILCGLWRDVLNVTFENCSSLHRHMCTQGQANHTVIRVLSSDVTPEVTSTDLSNVHADKVILTSSSKSHATAPRVVTETFKTALDTNASLQSTEEINLINTNYTEDINVRSSTVASNPKRFRKTSSEETSFQIPLIIVLCVAVVVFLFVIIVWKRQQIFQRKDTADYERPVTFIRQLSNQLSISDTGYDVLRNVKTPDMNRERM